MMTNSQIESKNQFVSNERKIYGNFSTET